MSEGILRIIGMGTILALVAVSAAFLIARPGQDYHGHGKGREKMP
ncbi:hypothetical protein [uncultured Bilophila sp.]|nr:hypothetical protein [uncultured Bilophila sp.]